jgi:2-oxoisovalerate dehydrogenase E1 component beta subunit
MVRDALSAAESLASEGIEATVVDLRSLKPLDTELMLNAAARTGKVIVTHSANQNVGVGAEVAALIAEHVFESLDGPVIRLGAPDVPVPFSPPLEDAFRPNADKIAEAARKLAAY